MGRFLIFIGVVILLSIAGLFVYWLWSKVYRNIKRNDSVFEIEKEAHKKLKREIKEEK